MPVEHTPGPWRNGTINYADVYGPDGEVVAMVPKGFESTVANARLIAAAPDLLAACKAVAALCSWDLGLPPDPELPHEGKLAWALIRNAVAKAEGCAEDAAAQAKLGAK